jgi:hypothetical protein
MDPYQGGGLNPHHRGGLNPHHRGRIDPATLTSHGTYGPDPRTTHRIAARFHVILAVTVLREPRHPQFRRTTAI